MKKALFLIVVTLLLATSIFINATYAAQPPDIQRFNITYFDFSLLHDPVAIDFIGSYASYRGLNIDKLMMRDIGKFIDRYARQHGYDTPMPGILDKMFLRFRKNIIRNREISRRPI